MAAKINMRLDKNEMPYNQPDKSQKSRDDRER